MHRPLKVKPRRLKRLLKPHRVRLRMLRLLLKPRRLKLRKLRAKQRLQSVMLVVLLVPLLALQALPLTRLRPPPKVLTSQRALLLVLQLLQLRLVRPRLVPKKLSVLLCKLQEAPKRQNKVPFRLKMTQRVR